jgi:hypothetical protein
MNDKFERSWKKTAVAYSGCYLGIYLKGWRNSTIILCQDGRRPDLDSNRGPPQCKFGALPLDKLLGGRRTKGKEVK